MDNRRWVNDQNEWYAATFSCPLGKERIWWKMVEGIREGLWNPGDAMAVRWNKEYVKEAQVL